MAGYVVVDASLAVKWLVVEEYTQEANALALRWSAEDTQMVAPYHMRIEAVNALHKRMVRGEHTFEAVTSGIESLLARDIGLHDVSGLHVRAAELAALLRQGAVYDAHYLALAEALGCEMWTADHRFHRAASASGREVRWVGESVSPDVV